MTQTRRSIDHTQRPDIAAPTSDVWRMWFDGSAAPNPGALGMGVVFESPEGERWRDASRLPHGCNNSAEMHALMRGLQMARDMGIRRLAVYSDSDFVVRHVRGEQRTGIAPLKTLIEEARGLMAGFEHVHLTWIPRHRNGEADTLARAALGLPSKPAKRPISARRR